MAKMPTQPLDRIWKPRDIKKTPQKTNIGVIQKVKKYEKNCNRAHRT